MQVELLELIELRLLANLQILVVELVEIWELVLQMRLKCLRLWKEMYKLGNHLINSSTGLESCSHTS